MFIPYIRQIYSGQEVLARIQSAGQQKERTGFVLVTGSRSGGSIVGGHWSLVAGKVAVQVVVTVSRYSSSTSSRYGSSINR